MTTATKTIREVISVSRQGATIRNGDETVTLPWGTLRAAAKQDDADLVAEYAPLLKQALAAAKDHREVTVSVNNETHTNHGFAAVIHDVAGEFVSGRIVAADFGGNGSRAEANADVDRAKERLAKKGYTVHASYVGSL